jgi:hypothetical protein
MSSWLTIEHLVPSVVSNESHGVVTESAGDGDGSLGPAEQTKEETERETSGLGTSLEVSTSVVVDFNVLFNDNFGVSVDHDFIGESPLDKVASVRIVHETLVIVVELNDRKSELFKD